MDKDIDSLISDIVEQLSLSLRNKEKAKLVTLGLLNRFEENVLSVNGLPDSGLIFYKTIFSSQWFLNTEIFENLLIDIRSSEFSYSYSQKLQICEELVSNSHFIEKENSGLVFLDF